MAKVGTYAAYNRLTPIQQDFTEDMQQAERLGFAYREEERKKKEAIDKKNKEFLDEFSASMGALTPFDTKVKSLNEYVFRALERGKEILPELYKKRENTGLSKSERIDAQMGIDQIEKLPEMLKNMTSGITSYVVSEREAVLNGTKIEDPDFETFVNNTFKFQDEGVDADIILDKSFVPMLIYKDNEGAIQKVSMNDYLSKNLPSNRNRMDINTLISNTSKLMGTDTTTKVNGLKTKTDVVANQSSVDFLNKTADNLFNMRSDGKPSDALYNVLYDAGYRGAELNNPSPDLIQEAKDIYRNGSLAALKLKDEEDYDNQMAFNWAKFNKEQEALELEIVTNPETEKIEEYQTEDGTKAYGVTNKSGQPFILNQTKNKQTRTDNVFVTKNGEMYADVYEVTKEDSKRIENKDGTFTIVEGEEDISKPITRKLSPAEASNVAKDRGYKNSIEMRKDLDQKAKALGGFVNSKVDEYGVPINN